MTKTELVARISVETGVERSEVLQIIDKFISYIQKYLADGEDVHIRNFGSFIVKERAAKKARNIIQNTTIVVPAHKFPTFKPSKQLIYYVQPKKLKTTE